MDTAQYKLMDAFFVWGLCLLVFGIVGSLLSNLIGIWAYFLCEALSVGVVLLVGHRTGMKRTVLLRIGSGTGKRGLSITAGSALIWAGCLLAAIPFFLFSHLLVPNFAVTCFHVYQAAFSSHWTVMGLILLMALSETLLFDGFLYLRVKGLRREWLVWLLLGCAYGLYHLDLYVLFPLALAGMGISYVRSRSGGLLIPFILRLITVTAALAYMQVSDSADVLTGISMGVLQVVGFAMIFLGAAIPSVVLGARLFGDWKNRSMFENCMVVAIAVVLIASGCGISSL